MDPRTSRFGSFDNNYVRATGGTISFAPGASEPTPYYGISDRPDSTFGSGCWQCTPATGLASSTYSSSARAPAPVLAGILAPGVPTAPTRCSFPAFTRQCRRSPRGSVGWRQCQRRELFCRSGWCRPSWDGRASRGDNVDQSRWLTIGHADNGHFGTQSALHPEPALPFRGGDRLRVFRNAVAQSPTFPRRKAVRRLCSMSFV